MEKGPAFLFRTSEFAFTRDAGERTKTGLYGKGLAEWVAERLPQHGIAVRGVVEGELGWYAVLETRPQMYVGCVREDSDHTRWRIFVLAERKWFDGLLGRNHGLQDAMPVYKPLKAILENAPDIDELRLEGAPGMRFARGPAA
jgi:hypothetical protein